MQNNHRRGAKTLFADRNLAVSWHETRTSGMRILAVIFILGIMGCISPTIELPLDMSKIHVLEEFGCACTNLPPGDWVLINLDEVR